MIELEQTLKDLEQGKISADHAEAVILRLFNVVGRSKQLPQPNCHFFDEEQNKWIWAYSKELIDSFIGTDISSCDCFIGFLSGEKVIKSELNQMVNDIVKLQPQLKKYGILNGEPNSAKQIVDGRKGYLNRFSYCPYCGNKIDWKTVLSSCC